MAGPPGVTQTTTTAPIPIGVPQGYSTQKTVPGVDLAEYNLPPIPTTTFNIPPRYYEGMQYTPASTLSADEIIDLQKRMEAAGLFSGAGEYVLGVWDQPTIKAYEELLANSNAANTDEKDTLARMMAAPKTDTTPRKPLTVHLSSPDDIKELVNTVGANLYGGRIPDHTSQAITDAIHASERAQQEQSYALDPTGGTVIDRPEGQTVAKNIIRSEHPNEVAATQFADTFDTILSTFTNPVANYSGVNYP